MPTSCRLWTLSNKLCTVRRYGTSKYKVVILCTKVYKVYIYIYIYILCTVVLVLPAKVCI